MTAEYDRFKTRVDSSAGPDACHLWTGSRIGGGAYGQFWVNGTNIAAHWWLIGYLRGKPLGPNAMALHHCDNPPCVNPKHLYIGDNSQNMLDRHVRGRIRYANSLKTACPHGHPYTAENTYRQSRGCRVCRTCKRLAYHRDRAPR